jgi:hypothetical protein
MSDVTPEDEHLIYATVASRRLQWDNLVWQVPILSLTAQAFLFTMALGPETSRLARMLCAGLALLIAILSVSLMARHRQAELADAWWLRDFEGRLPEGFQVHGEPWRSRRDAIRPADGWIGRVVPLWPGYKAWVIGLWLFGLVAIGVIAVAAVAPQLLHTNA